MKDPHRTEHPHGSNVHRRVVTALVGASVMAITLSGCQAREVFIPTVISEPSAPAGLVELYADYTALIANPKTPTTQRDFFTSQRNLLREEWVRLCGVDSSDASPQDCVDPTQADNVTVDDNLTVEDVILALVEQSVHARDNAEDPHTQADAHVLLGLAGALGAASAADSTGGELTDIRALPMSDLPNPNLGVSLQTTHGAVFATGLALAQDDGRNAALITHIRTALRDLSDRLQDRNERPDEQAPDLAAGYIPRPGLEVPHSPDEVVAFLAEVLAPVSAQLKLTSIQSPAQEDRRFAARWFVELCRLQASIEAARGINPLEQLVR